MGYKWGDSEQVNFGKTINKNLLGTIIWLLLGVLIVGVGIYLIARI